MTKSLSGRFLMLIIAVVILAEIAVLVPSVARFRADYLSLRLERAQIASLALLNGEMISPELEQELLRNAGVYNVVLRRDEMRRLALSSPVPEPISASYDLRAAGPVILIRDAIIRLATPADNIIRVIGMPVRDGGEEIEVTMQTAPLRDAMMAYGKRLLILSTIISGLVALAVLIAIRRMMVRPVRNVVRAMQDYAAAPRDGRKIITPQCKITEIYEAETALKGLQSELSSALHQQDRLAQLGSAVAKISHDLRNILTTAQLFTDRIESSEDPAVQRMAPKLVASIRRAVSLCENSLAFGRAEEAQPQLQRFALAPLIEELLDAERLAAHDALTISTSIPSGMMIRADSEQLYRILGNLVRNARQAMEKQSGDITISAREDDSGWTISVQDNGPGLPKKARENLFAPFKGGTRKGGSGLGLAIAAELVRGHGGDITLRAQSSAQSGTVFDVYMPK